MIHHYHPSTGEYLGRGQGQPSPLEGGKELLPANATWAVPPNEIEGYTRCWDSGESTWKQMPVLVSDPLPPSKLESKLYVPTVREKLLMELSALQYRILQTLVKDDPEIKALQSQIRALGG